jgi:putative transposase
LTAGSSKELALHSGTNAVGNVNAAGLAKTRLAKSVLDAGWSSFRYMLRYKALAHGAGYEEGNESFSSRDCSFCASETGPKGVAVLGIRRWVCSECGVSHDRNVNSALNILFRSGHRTPAEGIPALLGRGDVNQFIAQGIRPGHFLKIGAG